MSLLPESRLLRYGLAAAVLAAFVSLLVWYFDSDRALRLRDRELLEWARTGSGGSFEADFAAPGYHDQWGHTPADVAMLARAVRLQSPNFRIEAGEPEIARDGETATITRHLRITGAGDTLEGDFHFTWHKGSAWPWSWKLQEVTAPGVER